MKRILDFCRNLLLLILYCVANLIRVLIYSSVNCGAHSIYALSKIKIFGFKRSLFILFLFPFIAFSANQQDLEKLIALQKTQQTHVDLSNADLRDYSFVSGKIDLQQANISHSNLAGVDLSKMNLSGADLSYSNLSQAKLNQVNLKGANLSHANLTGAELKQTDFSRANLSYALLTSASLQQAILSGANLSCANLNHADLSQSNFADANISGATLINTVTNDISGYESVVENHINCENGS